MFANDPQISLERVIGTSVLDSSGMAVAPATGLLAYICGSKVVLVDPASSAAAKKQLILSNPRNIPLRALTFAPDRSPILIAGEMNARNCNLLIWELPPPASCPNPNFTREPAMQVETDFKSIEYLGFAPGRTAVVYGMVAGESHALALYRDGACVVNVELDSPLTGVHQESAEGAPVAIATVGYNYVAFWTLSQEKG